MVARGCSRHIRDRAAALACVDRSFQRQRYRITDVQRSDGPQSSGRIVSSLCRSTIECRGSQTGRKQVGQADVGRLCCAIVSDGDVVSNNVAYRWSRIATSKSLHGNQVSRIVDDY